MLKKLKILFFVIILGFVFNSGYAYKASDFTVYISLKKLTFYADENISLRIIVQNISKSNQLFYIYDKPSGESNNYSTFQPVVLNHRGNEAETLVPYKLEGRSVDQFITKLKKRPITIAPGESIARTVNLRNIYKLIPGVKYRVKSYFLPDFEKRTVVPSNNLLNFIISEAKSDYLRSGIVTKRKRHAIVRDISSSEIVKLALYAEREKEWKKMLKYIDTEKYINSYSDFARRYNLAKFNKERLKIEQEFIKFLTRRRDDFLLDFKIISEDIDNRISYVSVVVSRKGVGKRDRYKYKYTLEKFKNFWLIIRLEATVLKGERT